MLRTSSSIKGDKFIYLFIERISRVLMRLDQKELLTSCAYHCNVVDSQSCPLIDGDNGYVEEITIDSRCELKRAY